MSDPRYTVAVKGEPPVWRARFEEDTLDCAGVGDCASSALLALELGSTDRPRQAAIIRSIVKQAAHLAVVYGHHNLAAELFERDAAAPTVQPADPRAETVPVSVGTEKP